MPLSATFRLIEESELVVAVLVVFSVSLPLFEKLPLPESDTATFVELSLLESFTELSELSE